VLTENEIPTKPMSCGDPSFTENVKVTWIGFEPMAYCLEGSCSIQLSYQVNAYFDRRQSKRKIACQPSPLIVY
jgi:hypothetical protein